MGFKPIRKKSFLLLEILVALFLSSMLTLICMKALTNAFICKNKVEKAHANVHARQSMHKTLFTILNQMEPKTLVLTKDNKGLSFTFNNIIDPDQNFAGKVNAKLFMHNKKGLLLELAKVSNKNTRQIHLDPKAKKLALSLEKQTILTLRLYDQENQKQEFVYLIEAGNTTHA